MKIKLAILEKDKIYLNRMTAVFGSKFADKCEIRSFTDPVAALNVLDDARIDVLLASDVFDIDVSLLPKRCSFAYLVDSRDISTIKNQPAICKFQPADLIYKQILVVYAENASRIGFRMDGESARLILFTGVGGGVGTSTMAAACARHFAANKHKVLYLNLEKFGGADLFFQGPGQFDMNDVIFAVKSKKPNLNIKLDGCVKQDPSGVCFFSAPKIALDMMELTGEDTLQLLEVLSKNCSYEYIIVDMDFSLDAQALQIMRRMHAVVLVSNGTLQANVKTERAFAALATLERGADLPLTNRMSFLYNKVDNKTGMSIEIPGLRVLGGAPIHSRLNTEQLLAQLQQMDVFDSILQ